MISTIHKVSKSQSKYNWLKRQIYRYISLTKIPFDSFILTKSSKNNVPFFNIIIFNAYSAHARYKIVLSAKIGTFIPSTLSQISTAQHYFQFSFLILRLEKLHRFWRLVMNLEQLCLLCTSFAFLSYFSKLVFVTFLNYTKHHHLTKVTLTCI